MHYQYALKCLCRRVYNLCLNHPEEDIIIYKDDPVSVFRRICYHPDVAAAYTFVLGAYLVIPVGMVFGSRYVSSIFCLLSEMISFVSQFFHRLPLFSPIHSMINRFSSPHAPPSSRDINLAHKYPMNQGVDGTDLGPQTTFVDATIIAEGRSLIRQAAENSVLTESVFIGPVI